LRVVRLEILIRDWPIGEARTGQRSLDARFLEIDLAEAPEICREVIARTSDHAAVHDRGSSFCLVLLGFAKRVRRFAPVVREQVLLKDFDLVVNEVLLGAPRALLEHDDAITSGRQLLRDDTAGGARS